MTAAPDTETSVIVDLMLALRDLIERCDLAYKSGSTSLSIGTVRRIAVYALIHAQDSAQPTPAGRSAS